jgi:hypothetical protein
MDEAIAYGKALPTPSSEATVAALAKKRDGFVAEQPTANSGTSK